MKIKCAECGADVEVTVADAFIRCPYCDSTLYLDRAHTFTHFLLKPAVSATRARDLLFSEWKKNELKPLPLHEISGKLLPFWRVKGGGMGETIPAFPPPHGSLARYRLPAAEAGFFVEAPDGFEEVACSEASSAQWEGESDLKSFSLFHVPFFKVEIGSDKALYTVWIDAVSGRVFYDESPPSLESGISARFWLVMVGLFLLFTAEAFILPGFFALVAVVITAGALFSLLGNFFKGGG